MVLKSNPRHLRKQVIACWPVDCVNYTDDNRPDVHTDEYDNRRQQGEEEKGKRKYSSSNSETQHNI